MYVVLKAQREFEFLIIGSSSFHMCAQFVDFFRLNALVAGGLHPRGFHIVNIILHGVVSVVFLRVFSLLLGGAQGSQSATAGFAAPRASFLSGILFAVHPIHTEAVSPFICNFVIKTSLKVSFF